MLPAETEVGALCSGRGILRGGWRVRRRGRAFQANCFAADQLQPCPPDAAAWPVVPQHGSKRGRRRHVFKRGRSLREGRFERPQHGTHPSRLDAGTAFLTLRTQWTRATMANTSGIQDSQGAITLDAPFLGIERTISGATQRPIWLWGKG